MTKALGKDEYIRPTQLWVEKLVVGLNLCPFAKRELAKNRVRFSVSEAETEDQLLLDIQSELELLKKDDNIETTLLIHPHVLQSFDDYNQYLNVIDELLVHLKLDGIFQIASFHPDYQFGGTAADDVENYTNRSPYPMLHLIREASLAKAVDSYPDPDQIPQRNIELMNKMGLKKVQALLNTCFEHHK